MRLAAKTLILAAVLGWSAAAQADTVVVNRLAYQMVQIADVSKGEVTFLLSGRRISKQLADVTVMDVAGMVEFNSAEKLMEQGRPSDALGMYEQALRKTSTGSWQHSMVRCRRLPALAKVGSTDQAVAEWLALAEAGDAAAPLLALRPTVLAAKGAPQNAKAIAMLEAKLPAAADKPTYALAVKQLLMELYSRQGMTDKATALARELSATQPASKPDASTPGQPEARPGAVSRLRAQQVLVEQGKAAEALPEILRGMRGYSEEELPTALLLAGQAQMMLGQAAEGDEARKLLIAAGLNFMRVAAYYPHSAQAPQALLEAGKVSAALGNASAAANAMQAVIKNYPNSPQAAQAAAMKSNNGN